jgi:hypothetical protein
MAGVPLTVTLVIDPVAALQLLGATLGVEVSCGRAFTFTVAVVLLLQELKAVPVTVYVVVTVGLTEIEVPFCVVDQV